MTTTLPIQDQRLLRQAFIHRSYLNESSEFFQSNERLEYLGDAVLELVVSQHLYQRFPQQPEGELTALRAALVKTTTLAQVATQLDFGNHLLMSKGEAQTGGRTNQSLLANTFEAVIGAIYLDSDLPSVASFLDTHLFPLIPKIIQNNLHRDYKSTFQERVQSAGHSTPTYQLSQETGPDHDKVFQMVLMVGNKKIATGSGKSKQLAEQNAAQAGLDKLDAGYKI